MCTSVNVVVRLQTLEFLVVLEFISLLYRLDNLCNHPDNSSAHAGSLFRGVKRQGPNI